LSEPLQCCWREATRHECCDVSDQLALQAQLEVPVEFLCAEEFVSRDARLEVARDDRSVLDPEEFQVALPAFECLAVEQGDRLASLRGGRAGLLHVDMHAFLVGNYDVELPVAIHVYDFELRSDSAAAFNLMWDELRGAFLRAGPLEPVEHHRLPAAGIIAVVREVSLAGDEVHASVVVHVGQDDRVRLREPLEYLVSFPRDFPVGLDLLVPPDPVGVRRTRQYVRVAVTVEIVGYQIGAAASKVGSMKLPVALCAVGGRFEPALGGEYVAASVAVDVAESEGVSRRRLFVPGGIHVMARPLRCLRIARRGAPGHLSPSREYRHRLPVAQKIAVQRSLVAGGLCEQMLFPGSRLALGVLQPDRRAVAPADDYYRIDPPVAVHVVGEVGEALAVGLGRIVAARLVAERMRLEIRRLVPHVACKYVELAVAVYVSGCDSFGPEGLVDHNLPECNPTAGGAGQQADGHYRCKIASGEAFVHVHGGLLVSH